MYENCGTRDSPKLRARVPEVLHLAAKLHATRNRRSLAEVVADALESYLPERDKRDAREAARAAG